MCLKAERRKMRQMEHTNENVRNDETQRKRTERSGKQQKTQEGIE
jgi:hypothetical protein